MGPVRVFILLICLALPAMSAPTEQIVDEPLPDVSFLLKDNKLSVLSDAPTKIKEGSRATVIVMWASWCPYCRSQLSGLKRLYTENKDKGLQIIAVSIDEKAEDAKKEALRMQYPFPILHDSDKSVQKRLKVGKIPDTYVLDGNLKTVSVYRGMSSDRYTYLRKRVRSMLDQLEEE